jgi:hypothetical protein
MKKKKMPKLESPVEEVFGDFLSQVFKHIYDQGHSFGIWKMHCNSRNGNAPKWLVSFYLTLQHPPSNLDEILRLQGDIHLIYDADMPSERYYSPVETLDWAKAVYQKFATHFFEHQNYFRDEYMNV